MAAPRLKTFVFNAGDRQLSESIGFSAGSIIVDNPTGQYLFFPSPIQRFIAPSGNAVIIAGIEQANFVWQAPVGKTQPAAVTGQFATIVYIDSYLSPSFWAPGTGMNNPMTTLGDLIVGSTAGAPDRLAVGPDGQIVMADSTKTDGIKWAPPSTNALAPAAVAYAAIIGGGTAAANDQHVHAVALTKLIAQLAADTGVTNAAWTDLLSLATGATGVWLIVASCLAKGGDVAAEEMAIQITDGTTTYAVAAGYCANVAGAAVEQQLTTAAIVTNPAANLKVQGTTSRAAAGDAFKAASINGGGNKATTLIAVRLG